LSTNDIIFFAVFFWVLFITARLVVFALKIDIRLKKRIWPMIILTLGVVLIGFAYLLGFPAESYYILLPVVAFIIFANLRGFYFCQACGRMLAHRKLLSPPKVCAICGTVLDS
jgi:uncharacterized oligopeptide transporter (OPT) family protein